VAAKTILLLFALIVVVILLLEAPGTSSIARSQSHGERALVIRRLKDVPILIKVKKEKESSFKTFENGAWVREFELDLTNTGDKPIYFVFIQLVTDVKLDNRPLMFTLQYGRSELGDIITKASAEDVPIKPGETHVFKIHPGQVPAWERSVREGRQAEATRLEVALQMLSFGDGTGYFVNEPYPPARTHRSSCLEILDLRSPQAYKSAC